MNHPKSMFQLSGVHCSTKLCLRVVTSLHVLQPNRPPFIPSVESLGSVQPMLFLAVSDSSRISWRSVAEDEYGRAIHRTLNPKP